MRRFARIALFLGTAAAVFGLSAYHASVVAVPHYVLAKQGVQLAWTFAYFTWLVLASYSIGLPDLPRTSRMAVASAIAAPVSAAAAMSFVQLAAGSALLPRFVVFGTVAAMVPWGLACVAMAQGGRLRAEGRDRVVVVAAEADAQALVDELAHGPERPATVVSILTPAAAAQRGDGVEPLRDAVVATNATVVVLDRAAQADEGVVSQAAVLHEQGVRLRTLSLFYEQWLGKLPIGELERVSLMFDIGEVHRARYGRVKRILDIVAGLLGTIALGLVLPFVLVGNLLGNRGPLLYRQPRIGKRSQPFTIWKFRTMREARPDDPTDWTGEADPRITPFGRVLRLSHLDELPQMVNILRGDLSIVGPRPEQPRYVSDLEQKLPFYNLRHLIRPGLTGWAQVKFGYAGTEAEALEKLQYEFFYLRHQNISLDVRIIARTVRHVLRAGGR